MSVGEGKFVLYSRIEPPLEAGDYRFTANQTLAANGLSAGQLPVDPLPIHVTVRSPRYTLPPDQVLSTFPPAASEGAYGSRLPQVVIRRRTLPWERIVQAGVPRSTPWIALVLVAEGEAELKLNQPVADCVTAGKSPAGKADVEIGNYLQIRKSMVDRIFPTRLDVPLLAHAREVDIHDTELMMGDDDGFLAVVISNRLPLPGRDSNGDPVPVKYLAALVNLEGQFTDLIEKAPEPAAVTILPNKVADIHADIAQWDHTQMGRLPYGGKLPMTGGPGTGPGPKTLGSTGQSVGSVVAEPSSASTSSATSATWSAQTGAYSHADVYSQMARGFTEATVSGFIAGNEVAFDQTMRFPVLLHWSFTSSGSTTFRSLMEGLDSGLLGTVPEEHDESGRMPLEVLETGHTGLVHRTRRGDQVRSWYRGPFVPHPTVDPPGGRIPLAHAADQLRIVVPDTREDISIAAAFEIGRLLALARPSMVAALMRWRQIGYQEARRGAVWGEFGAFLDDVLGVDERVIDARIGVLLGKRLAKAVVTRPEDFLGDPRPLVEAGRPLTLHGDTGELLAKGFGLDENVFSGDRVSVLDQIRGSSVVRADAVLPIADVRSSLTSVLDLEVDRLMTEALTVQPRDVRVLDRLVAKVRAAEADDDTTGEDVR